VLLKEGEHFTRARKRIRDALIANGIAARIESMVAKLLDAQSLGQVSRRRKRA
jgi:hypothetical protein